METECDRLECDRLECGCVFEGNVEIVRCPRHEFLFGCPDEGGHDLQN